MAPREWLKPPRSLLVILSLVTLVSVSAIGWLGWKLLDQERLIESQRRQEQLEQSADRVTAVARGTLAEAGERVSSWLIAAPSQTTPDGGLRLVIPASGSLNVLPGRQLIFRPSLTPPTEPEDSPTAFAEGEGFEFQQNLPGRAAEAYRRLADARDPGIRGPALMRLARVVRKSGQTAEAVKTYRRLIADDASQQITFSGVPAGVAARLAGEPSDIPRESLELAQATEEWWKNPGRESNTSGQTTVWAADHPYLVLWRGTPNRRAVLITRPEALLKPIMSDGSVAFAAVDGDGKVVAGRRNGGGYAAVRTPAETGLPWTLYLTNSQRERETGIVVRQRFLLLITGVMVAFLIVGAYFIAHAIRSDLAVARMQSDFVSAVSHEFRSPLTSIRQLSELLAFGRTPNEGRRQVYYETLVRESTRLQRLVEALLNFGRMEAGVRQYRFEALEASELVSRVAAEFDGQIQAAGRRLELEGATRECTIQADPEAISVALRNLLDNALKYAPDSRAIRVEWGTNEAGVAIRVSDDGPGIPASEQRAIFRKFVRGSAAQAGNVRGSGVGLAMVRHIVAAHGGSVRLVSEPGKGSVFTIVLPPGPKMLVEVAEGRING